MACAYYNEIDPKKAAWLRELMKAGVIAEGEVDERSVGSVQPGDLAGYAQCHFFAGIGAWSYALRLAGWSDDEPVWTGSCPCQPFSAAGTRKGTQDERHLWPAWFRLIRERRPGVVFAEQVASRDGLAWLDIVRYDLEAEAYTSGTLDLCAAGFGAPHLRQRLFIVADTSSPRCEGNGSQPLQRVGTSGGPLLCASGPGAVNKLGNAAGAGSLSGAHNRICGSEEGGRPWDAESERSGNSGKLGDSNQTGPQGFGIRWNSADQCIAGPPGMAGPTNGFWADAEWIWCRDGKWRPAQSVPESLDDVTATDLGSCSIQGRRVFFPLQKKSKARILRLRGYGDAIVSQVAAQFIRAYMEIRREQG